MKYFLTILLLITCSFGYSQNIQQRSNSAVTVQDDRWKARLNAFMPIYADTTQANLNKGIDSIGAIIFTRDINALWLRKGNPKRWELVGNGISTTYYGVDSVTVDNNNLICVWKGGISNCYTLSTSTGDTSITGIDSVKVIGDQLCQYKSGVQTCYTVTSTVINESTIINYITNIAITNVYGSGIDSVKFDGYTICVYYPDTTNCYNLYRYVDSGYLSLDSLTYVLTRGGVPAFTLPTLLKSFAAGDSCISLRDSSNGVTYLYFNPNCGGNVPQQTITWAVRDSISTPAVSPADGDKYLVGTSPTGAFVTHANQIATWDSTNVVYTFETATTGDLLYNATLDVVDRFNGSVWIRVTSPTIANWSLRKNLIGSDSSMLGTVDNKPIRIYTNNIERANFRSSGQLSMSPTSASANTNSNQIVFQSRNGSGVAIDVAAISSESTAMALNSSSGIYNFNSGNTWWRGFGNGRLSAGSSLIINTFSTTQGVSVGNGYYQSAGKLLFNVFATSYYSGNPLNRLYMDTTGRTKLSDSATTVTPSAQFEVESIKRGSIPAPKMTAVQMNAIASPADGLMVYNLTDTAYYWYKFNTWTKFGTGSGGSTPTFQQVLTAGSTLTTNNTVSNGTNILTFTGSNSSDAAFKINNTNGASGTIALSVTGTDTSTAIKAVSTNGVGLFTTSTSGTAVNAASSSGIGVIGVSTSSTGVAGGSTSSYGGAFSTGPTSTNTVVPIINISRYNSSGTAANGIGGSIEYKTRTSTNADEISNTLVSKWTNATSASRTSQFDITGVNSAATETFANFQTGGIVRVNNLGDTLATKAYARSTGGGGGTPNIEQVLTAGAVATTAYESSNADGYGYWSGGYEYKESAGGGNIEVNAPAAGGSAAITYPLLGAPGYFGESVTINGVTTHAGVDGNINVGTIGGGGASKFTTNGYGILTDSTASLYTIKADTTVTAKLRDSKLNALTDTGTAIRSQVNTNTGGIALRLLISDTNNIRFRGIPGYGITVSGSYPNQTITLDSTITAKLRDTKLNSLTDTGTALRSQLNTNTSSIATNTASIVTNTAKSNKARFGTNIFPTETAVTAINNGKYNFTGLMDYFQDGTFVNITTQGRVHAGDTDIIVMQTSIDQGKTWSSATTIYSEVGVSCQNLGGGVTPTGRLIVFFGKYNGLTSTWLSEGYIYSDDRGVTWSSYTTISNGSNTAYSPYGQMQRIQGDSLIQGWYGINGSTYTQYVIKSGDNGATWGSAITVLSSGSVHYVEGSIVYLSGGNIIGVMRNDNGTGFRQVYSADNGTTWTDQGTATFEVTTSGNCRMGTLQKYLTPSGAQAVVFYYVNNPGGKLRSVTGFATDVISGVTGWGTPVDLATLDVSIFALGYPAFIHPFGQAQGFGTYCDQTSTTNANIRFITTPSVSVVKSLNIIAGTTTDLISPVKITGTLPSTITAGNTAIDVQITGAGSSAFFQRIANFNLVAGYTGSASTIVESVTNNSAGTGTGLISGSRNIASAPSAIGTTAGTNLAVFADAGNGNKNVGVIGRAITTKNSAWNVGVIGVGLNAGTSPVQVGGFFGLMSADPTLVSAALIADNGAIASPIQLWRDNGTVVATMADGGAVRIGDATSPTDKLEVTGNIALTTAGNKIKITEGSNGSVGQTTLVAGTKAITITGASTNTRAIVTFVSVGGTVTTTWQYKAVCTANTLTITAIDNTGATNTLDTSILNYLIIN